MKKTHPLEVKTISIKENKGFPGRFRLCELPHAHIHPSTHTFIVHYCTFPHYLNAAAIVSSYFECNITILQYHMT